MGKIAELLNRGMSREGKKIRLKKAVKRKLYLAGGAILLLAFAIIIIPRFIGGGNDDKPEVIKSVGTIRVDYYKDLNATHLKYAKANGIKGFKSNKEFRQQIDDLVDDDKLVKVETCDYYVVDKLTHSHPYLTPEAAELLEDIGKRFQEKLENNDLKIRYYQVTSLLRTGESQRGLSRSNVNASSNSSHLYGTTFDITYARVFTRPRLQKSAEIADGPAIRLLSEAIGELRKEGRCVVVTERKERCFHITVR
jgi:Family of unknown function (DUF5715)